MHYSVHGWTSENLALRPHWAICESWTWHLTARVVVTLVSQWVFLYDRWFNPLTSVKRPVVTDTGNPWVHGLFLLSWWQLWLNEKLFSSPSLTLLPYATFSFVLMQMFMWKNWMKLRSKSMYFPVLLIRWEISFKRHRQIKKTKSLFRVNAKWIWVFWFYQYNEKLKIICI